MQGGTSSGALARGRNAIRRYGVSGTLKRVWELTSADPVLRESHVWYSLDPAADRPPRDLAPELALRAGTVADLSLLTTLETIAPEEGDKRLREGHDWWLVLEGDRALFSCWIFRGQTPASAAPGGHVALPEGTVCLEDSVAHADARGRGIAPATWTTVAARLAAEGKRQMITKVAVENTPSRRAVEKIGFASVAIMHYRRFGPFSRTSLELQDTPGAFLLEQLEPRRAAQRAAARA